MKGSALTASAFLAATAHAADGVVHWDISKRHPLPKLTKRAGSAFTEQIANQQATGGYFATCSVGSPAQKLTLQLDTGSSDIWVPSVNAAQCTRQSEGGCPFGSCMLEYPRASWPRAENKCADLIDHSRFLSIHELHGGRRGPI